ncbi:IL15 protein, partial [Serilophus lunatus]|nr:IL15 protein [Serilophus lunatus]
MMCKVLIFGCISAAILMTAAYGAPLPTDEKEGLLKTLIKDLDLLKNITDVNHLDFYTANDKQECVRNTLQCYYTELNVLEPEGGNLQHLINIRKNLAKLMVESCHQPIKISVLQSHTSSETGCDKCEAHDKKKFPAFHQELLSVLQRMLK